jgi:MFS family permease
MGTEIHHPRLFYGWYVVAASFGMLFMGGAARFSFGVMFKPMIAEFGWSRGATSLAFFLNMVIFGLALPVAGRVYDRYGPKWVVIIPTLLLSTAYCLISLMTSLWQFLVLYGVLAAVGFAGPSLSIVGVLTSKWFEKWRGFAVALAMAGWCGGQFVLVPVITTVTLRYGWRVSHLVIGLAMLVVNLMVGFFVLKNPDTSDKGLVWSSENRAAGAPVESAQVDTVPALGLKQALRTYSFWLFLIVMFICGSGDYFVASHLIPFATDQGVSAVTAGNMLAWYALFGLAGLLLAGPASDLIGTRIPIAATFVIRAVLFLFILKYKTVTSLYVFALLFGFTYLASAPLVPILMGRLYGFSHLGTLAGFSNTLHFLGGGFGGYMGGLIFDRAGSYQPVFIISFFLAAAAAVCMMLIREKSHGVAS